MAHYNPIIDDPGFETDLITAASYGNCSRIQQILGDGETYVIVAFIRIDYSSSNAVMSMRRTSMAGLL